MRCSICRGPVVLQFRSNPHMPFITIPFHHCVTCGQWTLPSAVTPHDVSQRQS